MKNIELFLKDFTYNSRYELLEAGKNDSELKEIAEKRGIILPAKDLAVFKCIYAYIDRTNLNGCSLPQEEVEKSLQTLVGKAIDFDHLRGRIVGVWIDSKVIDKEIIAYGIFFKGNLQEDYETITELLSQNKLRVSFEAYGTREFKKDGTYDLRDIEFAGGGLLIETSPAFPGAQVTEMANKRILEFAKVMKAPEEFVHSRKEARLEKARMRTSDFDTIMRMMFEAKCPTCNEQFCLDVDELDFEESTAETTCVLCGTKAKVKFSPQSSFISYARTIEAINPLDKDSNTEKQNKGEKEEMTESKIEETVTPSEAKVEEPIVSPSEDLKQDEVEVKEEAKEDVAEQPVEQPKEEAKEEKPSETVSQPTEEVAKLKAEVELLKAELLKKDEELKVKIEEAKKETALLIERKNILGEFGKDISEADILNNDKFEIFRLKKENEELKKGKVESASLEVGGEKKTEKKDTPKEFEMQKRIQAKAFGK